MDDNALLRYSRHILLPEFGIEGQERLAAARVLVVGAGGLGSPACLYLAAAGVGTLVVADPDCVDLTNLQRQILHSSGSVGQPKVLSAANRLRALNDRVELIGLACRLEGDLLSSEVARADVVLDCSDNFATRHAVNRACVTQAWPLVAGAGVRFDGQVTVLDPRRADSPCYGCIFPEDTQPEEVRCAVMGVFAPLTGIIGTIQAAEAIKLIAHTGEPLIGKLLIVDALDMSFRSLRVRRDPQCTACGPARSAPGA
jgi:molybdopterin-synthase adenylyltransferase